MSDKKDAKYNETAQKKDEKDIKQALKSKSSICGVVSVPGLQFQSKVVTAKCDCGHIGETVVESAWNMKAYICCYYCGGYWGCRQRIRGHDYTLKDAIHKCGKCSKELNHYEAC